MATFGNAADFAAIMKGTKELTTGFEQGLKALQSFTTYLKDVTLSTMLRFVEVSNPATIIRYEMALTSLSGVLGQIFNPLIEQATVFVRELATWIYNLTPTTKAILAAIAVGAIAVTTGIAAVTAAVVGLNVVLAAFNTLTGGVVLVVGVLVTAFVGLVAGGVALAGYLGYLGGAMEGIGEIFSSLWTTVKTVTGAIWGVLQPFVEAWWRLFTGLLMRLSPIWESLKNVWAGWLTLMQLLGPETKSLAAMYENTLGPALRFIADVAVMVIKNTEKMIVALQQGIMVAKTLKELSEGGALLGMSQEEILRAVRLDLEIFERRRKAMKEAMEGKEEKTPAPLFGGAPKFGDIAAAKQEFQIAALRMGAASPEARAEKQRDDQRKEQQETNKKLDQLVDWLMRHGMPGGGLR